MRTCVVTGGRGFLARHLVRRLLGSGQWVVRIMDLAPRSKLSSEELQLLDSSSNAEYATGDLRDLESVKRAFQDAEVVFHMAAPDSSINNYQLHFSVNVTGTSNVIEACVELGVKKLIYTSSPSVVFDFINGMKNADESVPYPSEHMDTYSATKAQGEALVLQANGRGGLVTCAIRPSGIFGPGDKLFLPSIAKAAKAGKLKFQIGNGENEFDWTYVENVVHGHICAEEALIPGVFEGENVAAGKAYFITNCEPMQFWEFVSQFLERLGYERPKYKLPVSLVLPLSFIAEWICHALAPLGVPMTQFTPSRIRYMTRWRTFSCQRATQLLNYAPLYNVEQGIQKTVDESDYLRNADAPLPQRGRGNIAIFLVAVIFLLIIYRMFWVI